MPLDTLYDIPDIASRFEKNISQVEALKSAHLFTYLVLYGIPLAAGVLSCVYYNCGKCFEGFIECFK